MKEFIFTLATGIVFGIIDILPMIKMKLDKFSISSAFVFYLILPFIVYSTDLFGMPWWLRGGITAMLVSAPTIILIAKEDIKSVVPVIVMSPTLGTLIGIAGHFLWKVI